MRSFGWRVLAMVAVLTVSCKPKPPADTVSKDSTMDSVGTDSELVDQNQGWPSEFPPEPPLTAADTTLTPQDSAAIKAKKHLRSAPSSQGRALGFSTIPRDKWCTGDANSTIVSGDPDFLAGTIRKAAECNMGIYWTIPRSMMTSNGAQSGPFSLTKAKHAVDVISAVVNPLVPRYGNWMLGQSLLDDFRNPADWGGNVVPLDQIVELVKYAHDKYDSAIPLGIRGEATYLKGANFEGKLDYNVDQWHKKKGPKTITNMSDKQMAWYREQATVAKSLGITRQIYAVNVGDLNGGDPGTELASPSDMTLFVGNAETFDPADAPSCGVLNWKWDYHFSSGNYPTAIDALAFKATQQTRRSCRGSSS